MTGKPLPFKFDWKNPDYAVVFRYRMAGLKWLRENPEQIAPLKSYYRENPADFISDWGITYEPRNAERGLPTVIPFILFQRQREFVDWIVEHWRSQTPGLGD